MLRNVSIGLASWPGLAGQPIYQALRWRLSLFEIWLARKDIFSGIPWREETIPREAGSRRPCFPRDEWTNRLEYEMQAYFDAARLVLL